MSKIHLETSHGVVLRSYEDLRRHHESSGDEPGRSYAIAPNGEREEVRSVTRDSGESVLLFKKDLALVREDTNSDSNVPVPSPIKPAGYISYLNDRTNTAIIYDRPYDPSQPEPNRLAYIMHMAVEPRMIPEGGKVEYGQPIGIQSDVGSPGQIHVHIEAEYPVLRGYVDDFINGRLTTQGTVQDTPAPIQTPTTPLPTNPTPTNQPSVNQPSTNEIPTNPKPTNAVSTTANLSLTDAALDRRQTLSTDTTVAQQTPPPAGDTPPVPTTGNGQQAIPPELRAPHGNISSWYLGQTSVRYESGGGGPGTISTGQGDYGGKSYGIYQFASNPDVGGLQEYVNGSKAFGAELRGIPLASAEFDRKWREIAQRDPQGFANDQHDFIKAQYFDVQNERLKERGIDLSDRGRAVQDMLWSTSVQYRNLTPGIFEKGLREAHGHTDVSKLTDEQIVTAVQDYKNRNVNSHFSGSPGWWADLRDRTQNEKADLTALARDEQALKRGGINVPIDMNRGPDNDALNGNRRTLADGVLSFGEKSDAVKQLQEALNRAGARDDKGRTLNPDRDFGESTRQAVANYQKANGLEPTGVADAQVFAKLGLSFNLPQQTPTTTPSQERTNNTAPVGNPTTLSQDATGRVEPTLVTRPGAPGHEWYQQAMTAMDRLPPDQVRHDRREPVAAELAFQAMSAPDDRRLTAIRSIATDGNGSLWLSDKERLGDPAARVLPVIPQANDGLSIRDWSQKIAELPETNRTPPKELTAMVQPVSPAPALDEEKKLAAPSR
jgi:hypothetical protein